MTGKTQVRPQPDALCAECGDRFQCPAVAKCPTCGSTQIRRIEPPTMAAQLFAMGVALGRVQEQSLKADAS